MPIRRARCGRCQAKSADNTGCCKGERRQWRKQRTEAGAAVAECEGLLPPKHDAGTATRHYRAFWQHRCRAAAAGAVLKPQGGNCAVLPIMNNGGGSRCAAQKILGLLCVGNRRQIIERSKPFPIKSQKSPRRGKLLPQRRGGSALYILGNTA